MDDLYPKAGVDQSMGAGLKGDDPSSRVSGVGFHGILAGGGHAEFGDDVRGGVVRGAHGNGDAYMGKWMVVFRFGEVLPPTPPQPHSRGTPSPGGSVRG